MNLLSLVQKKPVRYFIFKYYKVYLFLLISLLLSVYSSIVYLNWVTQSVIPEHIKFFSFIVQYVFVIAGLFILFIFLNEKYNLLFLNPNIIYSKLIDDQYIMQIEYHIKFNKFLPKNKYFIHIYKVGQDRPLISNDITIDIKEDINIEKFINHMKELHKEITEDAILNNVIKRETKIKKEKQRLSSLTIN